MPIGRFVAAFFLTALCLAAGASAATPGAAAVSVKPGEVLRGNFVQLRIMQGFDKPLRSEGHFTVAPPDGLIWEVAKPFSIVTVITAKGLVQHSGGAETVNFSADKMPFVAQLFDMISSVLTGDRSALEKKFSVEQSGTPESWRIKLVPRKKTDPLMPFSEIRVAGDRFVKTVTMVRPNGDSDVLTFDGMTLTSGPLTPQERAALKR